MSVEISAADELADQRVGSNELLVDNAEKLERGKHGAKLVIAFDALGDGGEEVCGRFVHDGHFVGECRVEQEVGFVFKRRDIGLFAAAYICPHFEGLCRIRASEVEVAHRAADESEPCALKAYLTVELNRCCSAEI